MSYIVSPPGSPANDWDRFRLYTIPDGHTLFTEDLEHVEQCADAVWGELKGARLFITGGTGFFGVWLLESLLWANRRRNLGMALTVLVRSPERFLASRGRHFKDHQCLTFASGSVTDFDPNGSYTHIIHAASVTNPDGSREWAARHLEAAIGGTNRVLRIAAEHGARAVLLTSSGAVYDAHGDVIINDRCTEGPNGISDYVAEKRIYGQAKRMMEIMAAVEAERHGFRALIARCFSFVGPYLPLDTNYAIGNFIRNALDGEEIAVSGDGTPLRSYLYAADLTVWLLTILAKGESGRPYNVGADDQISIADLAQLVARAARQQGHVRIRMPATAGAKPSAYLPLTQRARDELGLTPRIDLTEAIGRTLAWHRLRATLDGGPAM